MKYLVNVLVLLSSLIPTLALAQWFEIEVAVFSRPDASGEHWPAEQASFERRNTLTLASSRQNGSPYALSPSQLKFSKKINQINSLPGHKVLAHQGWRMSVLSRNSAVPIAIVGGENLTGLLPTPQAVADLNTPLANSTNSATADGTPSLPAQIPPRAEWQLEGWLNVWLNHYLYVEAQLDLKQQALRVPTVSDRNNFVITEANPNALIPDEPATVSADPQQTHSPRINTAVEATEPYWQIIPMRQTRRMRSNEVHYLDHPQMGVIVQIRRL